MAGLIAILVLPLLCSLASAETYKQNQELDWKVPCFNNGTYCSGSAECNLTVLYPNKTTVLDNVLMTNSVAFHNYTIPLDTLSELGEYSWIAMCCDGVFCGAKDGSWEVTYTGEVFDNSQGLMLLGQLGIVALFLIIGLSFDKSKWKMRGMFILFSIMMGLITLNSIRIISGVSESLNSMGLMGVYLGIIILSIMFLYIFIYYLIEVFKYFKSKRELRWQVSSDPL